MSEIDFDNVATFPDNLLSDDERLHDYFKERVQYFFFNFTRKSNR